MRTCSGRSAARDTRHVSTAFAERLSHEAAHTEHRAQHCVQSRHRALTGAVTLDTNFIDPPVASRRPASWPSRRPGDAPRSRNSRRRGPARADELLRLQSRFTGGVSVTMADVNQDGVPDLILGASPGRPRTSRSSMAPRSINFKRRGDRRYRSARELLRVRRRVYRRRVRRGWQCNQRTVRRISSPARGRGSPTSRSSPARAGSSSKASWLSVLTSPGGVNVAAADFDATAGRTLSQERAGRQAHAREGVPRDRPGRASEFHGLQPAFTGGVNVAPPISTETVRRPSSRGWCGRRVACEGVSRTDLNSLASFLASHTRFHRGRLRHGPRSGR